MDVNMTCILEYSMDPGVKTTAMFETSLDAKALAPDSFRSLDPYFRVNGVKPFRGPETAWSVSAVHNFKEIRCNVLATQTVPRMS